MHLLFWVPGYNTILKDDPVRAPSKKSGALQEATQGKNQQSNFSIKYFLAFSDFTSDWKRRHIYFNGFQQSGPIILISSLIFSLLRTTQLHDSHVNDPYLSYPGPWLLSTSNDWNRFLCPPNVNNKSEQSVWGGILQSHICTCKATKQHFVGALLALVMAHIHHATSQQSGDLGLVMEESDRCLMSSPAHPKGSILSSGFCVGQSMCENDWFHCKALKLIHYHNHSIFCFDRISSSGF